MWTRKAKPAVPQKHDDVSKRLTAMNGRLTKIERGIRELADQTDCIRALLTESLTASTELGATMNRRFQIVENNVKVSVPDLPRNALHRIIHMLITGDGVAPCLRSDQEAQMAVGLRSPLAVRWDPPPASK